MVGERNYLFEYRHADRWWGIQIPASDAADAEARIKALAFAHYKGEVIANISIPGSGLWSQAIRLLRRLLGKSGT